MARKSDSRQARPGAYPGRRAAYAGAGRPQDTDPPGSAPHGRDAGRALRVLALVAVVAGLAALTAAACVLSYSSVHHLAVQAGAAGRLASIYPLIFDALLVLAGCSVLALRGAGLISRVYSWLCLLVLLAALAAGGAIRAAAVKVPHKLAAVVAAIVPWALVLIGFGLLLALLRYARLRRLGKRNVGPAGAAAGAAASSQAEDGAAATGEGNRAAAGSAAEARAAKTSDAAPAAARPLDAEKTGDAVQTTKRAHAASGGAGVEPPTVPGAAARPRQASLAGTPPAGQAEQATPAPAASAAETAAPARPGVRRAEMQLRARIPRQAAQDGGPNPVPPGWPAPFMPPVGQHGSPAQQAGAGPPPAATGGGEPPAGKGATPGRQAGTAGPPPAAGSGQAPAEQRGAAAARQATAAATNPGNPSDPGNPADEAESAAGGAASSLNPAPTVGDDDEEDGGPLAFRRTRSSPTPPQEDEEPS